MSNSSRHPPAWVQPVFGEPSISQGPSARPRHHNANSFSRPSTATQPRPVHPQRSSLLEPLPFPIHPGGAGGGGPGGGGAVGVIPMHADSHLLLQPVPQPPPSAAALDRGFSSYSPSGDPAATAVVESIAFKPDCECTLILRGLRTPAAPTFLGALAAQDRAKSFHTKFGPGYTLRVSQRAREGGDDYDDDRGSGTTGLDFELGVDFGGSAHGGSGGAAATARLFPLAVEVKLESLNGTHFVTRTYDIRGPGAHPLPGLGDPADVPAVDALRAWVTISLGASVARAPGRALVLKVFRSVVAGRDLVDTKFVVFSRRRDGGGADRPRAVYASSALLAPSSDYLATLLSNNGFAESQIQELEREETDYVSAYDYADDSDLEDGLDSGDEGGEDTDDDTVLSLDSLSLGVKAIDEDEPLTAPSSRPSKATPSKLTPSTSTSTSTVGGSSSASPRPDSNIIPSTIRPSSRLLEDENVKSDVKGKGPPVLGAFGPSKRTGRVIRIKDTAFITWRALILYLYTSQIVFAPLRSHPSYRVQMAQEQGEDAPPRASAKSIYRLADKIGMDSLATLALRHIESQITEANVLDELFSEFTSWYPLVRKMELRFAFDHWGALRGSEKLKDKLAQVARGELTHAAGLLFELVAK